MNKQKSRFSEVMDKAKVEPSMSLMERQRCILVKAQAQNTLKKTDKSSSIPVQGRKNWVVKPPETSEQKRRAERKLRVTLDAEM